VIDTVSLSNQELLYMYSQHILYMWSWDIDEIPIIALFLL
jgi:hypothetical protein